MNDVPCYTMEDDEFYTHSTKDTNFRGLAGVGTEAFSPHFDSHACAFPLRPPHARTHTHMHTHMRTHVHMHVHTCIHMHTHTPACTHTRVHTCTPTRTHAGNKCTVAGACGGRTSRAKALIMPRARLLTSSSWSMPRHPEGQACLSFPTRVWHRIRNSPVALRRGCQDGGPRQSGGSLTFRGNQNVLFSWMRGDIITGPGKPFSTQRFSITKQTQQFWNFV